MNNYRYLQKLQEICVARNQSSTAAKTRGVKYNVRQAKKIRMIAVSEEAPTIESILRAFPNVGSHKANVMLVDVKRIRKEIAILTGLTNVAGVHNAKNVGHLYLITHECFNGWVKCGMTTNLIKRLAVYNSSDPLQRFRYLVEKIVENRNKAETLLIYNLKNATNCCNGEWFRIDEQIARDIFDKI